MKKYLFFDIDGTLCGADGIIFTSTKRALRKLEENGHMVALTSGRAHFRAKEFADLNGISHYVCEGGNAICVHGKMVDYEAMDQTIFIQLCEAAQEKGIGFAFSNQDSRIRYSPNDNFHKQVHDFSNFMEVEVRPDIDFHDCGIIRRIFIAISKQDEDQLPLLKTVGYMRYNDNFVIIEPDDKFKGIQRMMQYLHADISEVVVFGDGYNDRKMFQDAPFCIAMGNAIPELKALADYISDACDQDGIWNACKHFEWI